MTDWTTKESIEEAAALFGQDIADIIRTANRVRDTLNEVIISHSPAHFHYLIECRDYLDRALTPPDESERMTITSNPFEDGDDDHLTAGRCSDSGGLGMDPPETPADHAYSEGGFDR